MEKVINDFHSLYYHSGIWTTTRWLGVPILKNPMDLMIYQETIHEIKPDILIECGTFNGGSAYFFACMFDLIGNGRVISIDLAPKPGLPSHPRIQYITASSTDPDTVGRVRSQLKPADQVMVVLDSDHSRAHVWKELECYHPMVTLGSYLVVEDTNINGHPVLPEFGPGPMEAVMEFVRGHDDFALDESKHKYFMTFNPKGYLRKVK